MEEVFNQLKEELESGKKSEYQLDEFLKSKNIKDKFCKSLLSALAKDKSVKVTRGGWFWATKYFELRQQQGERKSRKINNPESWIGFCPNPPQHRIWIL